jgi:oligosaccharide repeat unit polymerase
MNINLGKIANPYAIFIVAWALCITLYSFGWAGIYPKLSYQLLLFLVFFIFFFSLASIGYNKVKKLILNFTPVYLNYRLLLGIISLLWLISFIYSGIPVINGIKNDDFGITGVKNILTSLNNFTSVYLFYLFLITKQKKYIFYIIYCMSFYFLTVSRGNIMMTFLTMFFVWLNLNISVITIKKLGLILSGFLILLYLFGLAGNLRAINSVSSINPQFDNTYNSNIIMDIGDASDSFRKSPIPGEYFWTYAYITSPIANLQYNINNNRPELSVNGLITLFNNEILLDAFSTKINSAFKLNKKMPDQIVDGLAVSTTLAGSYLDAGWVGMCFFMVFLGSFPLIYMIFIVKNPLGVIGISTICTIYFFSIFDNMFILSGLCLQLVYPLIWGALKKLSL